MAKHDPIVDFEKFQKEQADQKRKFLQSLLETDAGRMFLRGADKFFEGTRRANAGLRAGAGSVGDFFSAEDDDGLQGLMEFFSPLRRGEGIELPEGFPVSRRRDVPFTPGPTATPAPNPLGFRPPTGNVDASSILFGPGVGRNEREGKMKDMERDLNLEDKMKKLQERIGRMGSGHNKPK